MSGRRTNLLILGLVAVLLTVSAYFIFLRQPVGQATQLGLDLRGGVSATLRGTQPEGEVSRQEMETAAEVIRQRVDRLGVAEPEIRVQGQNQIVVNIPGITDPERTIDVIGRTAQLGFYQVLAFAERPAVPEDRVDAVKDEIRDELQNDPAFREGETQILFEETPAPEGAGGGVYVAGYVVPNRPAVTGDALQPEGAQVQLDQAGRREVTLQLTGEGGEQFGDLTQQIVDDSVAEAQPGRLAVVLDEDVVSAPGVSEPIYGGQVVINNPGAGGLPEEEAEELTTVLNTGALPVNLETLSVQTIGPTLGADSLRSGLLAALVGFVLVLVFLLVVYRALGVVADLALLIYALLLWGLIVAIPVTITLPGIAGIVLSIGVAADANIVIFERIREEVRRGRSPRTAVGIGYKKGFLAILDGNLTTLITAGILFALSTGSVRGFAVLLALGVVLSMFTAVAVTRALLGVITTRGFHLSAPMMGVSKASITPERSREKGRVR
jgi:preprotein translocase subunit SecD